MEDCLQSYGGLVWSITRRYVGNETDAEDLVQEIFTEIWRVAERFDAKLGGETTFVGAVARRRSIDWLRKSKRRPALDPLPEDDHGLPAVTPDSSAACDGKTVLEILGHLPEDTQQLFRLHFESGMTHPEIAEKTGMPLGTVKTRLRRGLVDLRKAVARLEGAAQSGRHE